MADNSKKDSQALLETARKRFDLAAEAETEMRREALDDLMFRAGEQWPDEVKRARDSERRPCLTINRLPQFVRQVTNDQRQNRPAIKVSPIDDKADPEVAEIFQGIIRHIEYHSNADVAYDTAFEGAVTKGLGYFRVTTDYCDPQSFDQEISIRRIRNSFSVYMDPHYHEPDASDANWAFIFEEMSAEDYKAQYKNSDLSRMEDWKSIGDNAPGWATKESARVAEYFFKTFKDATIYQLSDGSVVDESKLEQAMLMGLTITGERKTQLPAIRWVKMNAVEVLDETEWLGQWIPIIPVLGDELDVDGKRILEGVIRHAKDPQRMYNYWASSETETIALAPRAPFVGAAGQFSGFEGQWATANTQSHAYLEYNPVTIGGQQAPAPQRQSYEPPVMAITNARMQSSEDLKATTGIYDASLGNRSNENSGVAIQRRNIQAQTNNFHYVDNLSRALRHLGRILVDLIPKVYDTARTARIIGEDGEQELVKINQIFEENGKQKIYNLGYGKYDVTVATGPSYASKRQEAVDSMLSFLQAYPNAAAIIGDLFAKNMDWPGAQEIAERLKKSLPPELQDAPDGQEPLPPQVAAQMQQLNQMVEAMTEQLNAAQDKIEQKTLELESEERIARAKMEVDLAKIEADLKKEMIKVDAQDARLLLQQEIAELNARQSQLRMNQEKQAEPAGGIPAEAAQPQMQPPTGGFTPGQPVE